MKNNKSVRLPSHITPIKYNLTLRPDLEAFTFEGYENIQIEIKRSSRQITLHAKDLQILSAECAGQEGKVTYNTKAETATITFPKALGKGRFSLNLAFTGILNDLMRGFYRSSYMHEGKKKHLATTQFEATDARRAFPSFDEPAAKAVFNISLVIPDHMEAVSNTIPAETTIHSPGYKLVRFEPTPKMSTYLAAFIVGELEHVEGRTRDGVIVRVHTVPGKKDQGRFALECAIKCLEFYNEYFDIPYPLPSLDMIAVPDFSSAAMENWGAVTYRESALLVDEDKTSAANKEWIAVVIAHELSHQWFGNLVTMEWWTHLWLNEGFASYMENLATDKLYPGWRIWEQFVSDRFAAALRLDALKNTHPIEVEVRHPDEISEIFDEVSYSKGSSVIRMLASYLGEKNFREGLRLYLKKHSYSNASTIHLWQAFEKVSGKPVAKMMRNWTSAAGYPVLSAELKRENKKELTLKLSQTRFFSSEMHRLAGRDKTVWQMPISELAAKQKKSQQRLLPVKSGIFTAPNTGWLKLNAGETGFFRVKYDDELLSRLALPVKNKVLGPTDRLGLVRDLSALSKSGQISSTALLQFLENYRGEDDYIVWVEIAGVLGSLDALLFDQKCHEAFRSFSLGLFKPLASRMGWQERSGDGHTDVLLRSLALSQAAYFGDADVIARAQKMFRDPEDIPADLRGAVYGIVARNGGLTEHKKFIELHEKETLHEERNRLAAALTRFTDTKLLQRSMEYMLSKNIRAQDAPLLIAASYYNNFSRELTWRFVQKHWRYFVGRYGEGLKMLTRLIKPLDGFHDKEHLSQVRSFFRKNPAPGAERTLQQALEGLEANVLWLKRDIKAISKFLANEI